MPAQSFLDREFLTDRFDLLPPGALLARSDLAEQALEGLVREMLRPMLREWLDANYPNWRDADDWYHMDGGTRYLVQNDTTLRIVPTPAEDGTLTIEAYRLPLKKLSADNDAASPEIHTAHHEHLLLWALHKAFSVPDAELIDPARAQKAEEGFTAYFGPMPDSDLRRITREDVAHYNRAVLM